jgi:phosphoribosylformylglycinamidine cyclo-ligase
VSTYEEAGVDLAAAEAVVARIAAGVTATWGPDVVGGFGGFAAGIRVPEGYQSPVMMMSTDGVGTKAEVARRAGRLEGLGSDLVAMCVDDLVAVGARPIAMTDYIAVDRLDVGQVETLVHSIAEACAAAGVALLGGETAEHPGVMPPGSFDLAGTALGIVESGQEVTGDTIAAGDVIIGLASPNLRSNGFSFIRAHLLAQLDLFDSLPGTDRSVAEALLEPSVVYAPTITELITRVPVHGMVHVTGGGIAGNLDRVLPKHVDGHIDRSRWEPPPVFEAVAAVTGAPTPEMFATFNMGIGFIVVIAAEDTPAALGALADGGAEGTVIGAISDGSGTTRIG